MSLSIAASLSVGKVQIWGRFYDPATDCTKLTLAET
jgi:hypothetical protein